MINLNTVEKMVDGFFMPIRHPILKTHFMIKTEELRVGNYFLAGKSTTPTRVLEISYERKDGHLINKQIPEDHCHPILITEEILLKAGFECSSKGFWQHPQWYNLSLKFHRGTYCVRCNFMDIVANNIDHVHELQNYFYCSTHSELNINL